MLSPPPTFLSFLLRQADNEDRCLFRDSLPKNRASDNEINSHNNSGNSKSNICYYAQYFIPRHICELGTVISRNQVDHQAGTHRAMVNNHMQVKVYVLGKQEMWAVFRAENVLYSIISNKRKFRIDSAILPSLKY